MSSQPAADGPRPAPLFGLVLAGGRSTRMRTDKAALLYGGRRQLERAMELITPHVERAYVSVRADQRDDLLRARYPQIQDLHDDLGPIAGLLAAQAHHPGVAWLVLACDLPLLDAATVAHLVSCRAPQSPATAYRSSRDGLPEPLCAIWEPCTAAALSAYVAAGRRCPRRFLVAAETRLLDEPDPQALDNVNTPEEYRSVMSALLPEASSDQKQITVQYYALLREQAGRREEALLTRARTAADLYAELRRRHPFSLAPEVLRVAINAEFREWTAPLADGDAVVFIPPVAGG